MAFCSLLSVFLLGVVIHLSIGAVAPGGGPAAIGLVSIVDVSRSDPSRPSVPADQQPAFIGLAPPAGLNGEPVDKASSDDVLLRDYFKAYFDRQLIAHGDRGAPDDKGGDRDTKVRERNDRSDRDDDWDDDDWDDDDWDDDD